MAIESGGNPEDPTLNALVLDHPRISRTAGIYLPGNDPILFDAGYKKEQLLEVLIGIWIKTISNYFDHIVPLEMDDEFKRMISSQG